jgi:hypothetical protein
LEKQKHYFEPNISFERKVIGDMKGEVQKITSEQLSTKKNTLNIEAEISKMEG